jgi:deazaflavin-dependent oxidoreductase (nitroreductase family)
MARTWLSIQMDLVEGYGEQYWPRPGRIFAAARSHSFKPAHAGQERAGASFVTARRTRPARSSKCSAVRLASVSDHYRAPGWFTRNVFNQLVAFLTRQGISVLGSRILAVKGRTSGQWRTTPVNLLTHENCRYLVSPRGETQWVRNLRAVGTGELRLGRRAEGFRGRELTDDEKVPVLRAYLKRWKAEVGIFFEGTGPDSSDDQILAIAPRHPAFEVLPVG